MNRYLLCFLHCALSVDAATFEIIETQNATQDVVVAVRADASPLQGQLDLLHRKGGGTLLLEAGHYELTKPLVIPQGCALRGDMQATVLKVLHRDGPAIQLSSASSLRGVALWWPEQRAEKISEYPPGISAPGTTTFQIEDVTFVNAYDGIRLGPESNSLCLVRRVKGTCLKRGLYEDRCKGVPRFQHLSFSPRYWEQSGLPNAPSKTGPHRKWMLENGTGIEWADADAFNVLDCEIEGYACGMSFIKAKVAASTGDLVLVKIWDCTVGIEAQSMQGAVRFSLSDITATKHALHLAREFGSPMMSLVMSHCRLSGGEAAILDDSTGKNGLVQFVSGELDGAVTLRRSGAGLIGCEFSERSAVQIAETAGDVILAGNRGLNRIQGKPTIYSEETLPLSNPPRPDDSAPLTARPAKAKLFVVEPSQDAAASIQASLDKAGANGGGIVFLPAGTYKLSKGIIVPSGVELRGPLDFWQRRVGRRVEHLGATLEVEFGAGSMDGPAVIELNERSGMRGITIHHPQDYHALKPYPWVVRGRGAEVYVISTFMVNPHAGIDFATHRCDRFLTDMVLMNPFARGLVVGSGSRGGFIQNTHMNSALWSHGFWTDGPPNMGHQDGVALDEHISRQLVAYDFPDCAETRLFSCFTHGSQHLYRLGSEKGSAELAVTLAGAESTVEAVVAENIGPRGVSLLNFHVLATKGHHRVPFTLKSSLRSSATMRGWNTLTFGYPTVLAEVHGGTLAFDLIGDFNSRTASRIRTSGNGKCVVLGSLSQNPIILEGSGVTHHAGRFSSLIGQGGLATLAPRTAICMMEEPPMENGLRLSHHEASHFAPQVCSPSQLDVLLPARIAKGGMMQFELTDSMFEPKQLIVNWHDSAPAGRSFTIEADGKVLSTVTTSGTRQWKVESLPLKTTPIDLILRFENNAAIAISQVELRQK